MDHMWRADTSGATNGRRQPRMHIHVKSRPFAELLPPREANAMRFSGRLDFSENTGKGRGKAFTGFLLRCAAALDYQSRALKLDPDQRPDSRSTSIVETL
jgi:hypothetical protein